MDVSELKYRLFSRVLTLRLHEHPGRDLFFFTMHDDETTSLRAGRRVIREQGGKLLELTHSGRRNVEIEVAGEVFQFDPNRMFSDEGVVRTLTEQSGADQVPDRVEKAVRTFAEFVLDQYQLVERSVLITLHNTMGDLTVEKYLDGAEFEQNAERVHTVPERHITDFFLVTEQNAFDAFRDRGWNVVLQNERHVTEDGSLSVRARDECVSYINVEAKLGHMNIQKRMIRELYEMSEMFSCRKDPGPRGFTG